MGCSTKIIGVRSGPDACEWRSLAECATVNGAEVTIELSDLPPSVTAIKVYTR